MNLKSLAKDTAIYGLSSIVGRFLNYLLVPLHTYRIAAESGGYGIVSNLYAYAALIFALLTFGMETTFFRFSGRKDEDEKMVYSCALRMVGAVGLGFVALVFAFLGGISDALGYAAHPEYVACFAVIGALDAFQAVMFARLRQQHRPMKFMLLKMSFIFLNVALNLFIFLLMPKIPQLTAIYERFNGGVGLIFFANLLCTSLVTLGFIPEIRGITYGFDRSLCRRMLAYSMPLLLLSLVSILNQTADKVLFPLLCPGEEGMVQLGIYGACVKIAMIMALLTQAFRYAYEPIVFSGAEKNSPQTLADGMKYFVIFTLAAFLCVIFYMPVLRHFVQQDYWEGLGTIPVVMMAEIFMGISMNLSFWYKLSDKTWWGALISLCGAVVMVAVNVIFVPRIGYWACAWGGFAGYGISMLLSYFLGQKYYPVRYELRSIGLYVLLALVLLLLYCLPEILGFEPGTWVKMALGTILLAAYCTPLALTMLRKLKSKSKHA